MNDRVRETVASLTRRTSAFAEKIHERDEMYLYNLDLLHDDPDCAAVLYYVKGHQAATALKEIGRWHFGELSAIGSTLDFASGYGRVTRFLVGELPPANLWVADAVREAVDFQRDYFAVHGFPSTAEPEDLDVPRRFAFVFACSLFSHLPEKTFGRWLARLVALVEDGGLLALSVLDMSLLGAASPTAGFVFLAESESRTLANDRYGTTYVTEERFRAILGEAGLGSLGVVRIPGGLCAHQDLYLIARRGELDSSSLEVTLLPRGELDLLELRGDSVELGGWVRDARPGGRIAELRALVNGRVRSTFAPQGERWSLTIGLDDAALDDLVVIEGVNDTGAGNVLAIGTLRPYVG